MALLTLTALLDYYTSLSPNRGNQNVSQFIAVPTPLGETGTQVSRIIQEALTNARRHSGAKKVTVSMKRDGDDLLIEVSDDGRGFGPETTPGVGLDSMRERAALSGGELDIESGVGRGTNVRLRVPLSGEAL